VTSPWAAEIPEDYERLMREFGIRSFSELLPRIKNPHRLMRRGVIFGHRDFDRVLEAMEKGEPYAVMTGLMPSGPMHLGHKMVIDELIWFQRLGAEIFLCVADIEAHIMRGLSYEETERIAVEEYLSNYMALGLDLEKCHLYFQSRSRTVKDLALRLGVHVNFSELRAIYGFGGESKASHIFYPLIDVSDILHVQLPEFGGPRPTVVPVGVDQDPHLRLARDLASRVGFVPPSSFYHRLMRGLLGEKMSSSRPETAVLFRDSAEEIGAKLWNAFTGGQPTEREQRELGGDPTKCVVFEILTYHLIEDDSELAAVAEACRAGELLCGECKRRTIERLIGFLDSCRKERERLLPKARELAKATF